LGSSTRSRKRHYDEPGRNYLHGATLGLTELQRRARVDQHHRFGAQQFSSCDSATQGTYHSQFRRGLPEIATRTIHSAFRTANWRRIPETFGTIATFRPRDQHNRIAGTTQFVRVGRQFNADQQLLVAEGEHSFNSVRTAACTTVPSPIRRTRLRRGRFTFDGNLHDRPRFRHRVPRCATFMARYSPEPVAARCRQHLSLCHQTVPFSPIVPLRAGHFP